VVTNMYDSTSMPGVEIESFRDATPFKRDYNGPLSLGDPGVSSSLWNSSRVANELFRDDRAYQPMDMITITISESSEGTKEADTEVKQSSTILNALTKILGFEAEIVKSNNNIGAEDLAGLINTSSQSDFKGEGDTTRKGTLKGSISAVVVEVLPGGLLRIEGEKIISVNREEQVMVISGLVRPKDVNSENEVMSTKVAQLRIDYYGKGVVGEAQNGGWMQRFLRKVWPF
ncbi:MAG: flagellar basal body L-ring protein FlgH, partial [Bdellovibrionales bacterium]|nr:flagellar basal body L-ring protein FlgH [Bdellovibrionales bacterium]